MSVEDRWHFASKSAAHAAGVTTPCPKRCKGTDRYPTEDHGRGMQYRVRNRGTTTMSFVKKGDADAHDADIKAKRNRGIVSVNRKDGLITFDEYVTDEWVAIRCPLENSRRKMHTNLTHIRPTFGHLTLNAIEAEPSRVNAWVATLRKTRSRRGPGMLHPNTIEQIYVTLATVLKAAVVDKRITTSPCAAADTPKTVKPAKRYAWSAEVAHGLIGHLPERDRLVGRLAAMAGARQGEAFAVSVASIDRFGRQLRIDHQVQRVTGKGLTLVPPKRDSVRTVPLDSETLALLAAHQLKFPAVTVGCECCPGAQHEVLFSHGGKLLDADSWNERAWHPALRAMKIKPAGKLTGLHELRHFYVSILAERGADMELVAELVGHRSSNTTKHVYGHLFQHSHDRVRAMLEASTPTTATVRSLRTTN
jgi:integrase